MPSRSVSAAKSLSDLPAIQLDPLESARAAGLRYVSDDEPGIRRKKSGQGFSHLGLDGKLIRDRKTIERINALAIPPAYKNVWIRAKENDHIQATRNGQSQTRRSGDSGTSATEAGAENRVNRKRVKPETSVGEIEIGA